MPKRVHVIWLVPLSVMLARIAYAVWLSPYEMVADEGQYWEWSRHLDWSYFEHGPGVAWVIAAATRTLGDSLWAIRAPSAVCGAIVMIAIAWLAGEADARHRQRAAAIAVAIVCLVPGYQLTFLIMTPDAPYLACWALAAAAGWRAVGSELDGRPALWAWVACGACIGAAILSNYAAGILLVALTGFLWTSRSRVNAGAWVRLAGAGVAAAIATLPIVVWNLQHDFAAFQHMRGYLALPGGIYPVRPASDLTLLHLPEYLGATCGVIGPAIALMWLSARRRPVSDHTRWLLWCALPILLIFLVASIRTRIQGNWPLPAFLTLVPLVATVVLHARDRTTVRWWRATVAYGVFAALVIHAPLAAAALPVAGRLVPLDRFRGMADAVRALAPTVAEVRARFGDQTPIVAASHNYAGRIAFYLPGQPIVLNAGRYFGRRITSYDFWEDTSLAGPPRPALLLGESAEAWQRAVRINGLEVIDPGGVFVASQFSVRAP